MTNITVCVQAADNHSIGTYEQIDEADNFTLASSVGHLSPYHNKPPPYGHNTSNYSLNTYTNGSDNGVQNMNMV